VFTLTAYMFLPVKLSIKVHAEILDVFGLSNLDSIQIDSRIGCGMRNECNMNFLFSLILIR